MTTVNGQAAGRPASVCPPWSGSGTPTWQSIGLGRREALWQIRTLGAEPLPLFAAANARVLPGDNCGPVEPGNEPDVDLPAMRRGEAAVEDYRSLSLTLRAYSLALLRPKLRDLGYSPTQGLESLADGKRAGVAGLVLVRQRAGTASGVVFVTLEDETRHANLLVWSAVFDCYRRVLLGATILGVWGRVQKEGEVIYVVADHLIDLSDLATELVRIDGPDGVAVADPVLPAAQNFRWRMRDTVKGITASPMTLFSRLRNIPLMLGITE